MDLYHCRGEQYRVCTTDTPTFWFSSWNISENNCDWPKQLQFLTHLMVLNTMVITVWVNSNIREISWQGILIPNTDHLFEVTKNDFENRKYSKMLWLMSYPKVATLLMFWTVFLKISEYKDQKRIRYIAIALVNILWFQMVSEIVHFDWGSGNRLENKNLNHTKRLFISTFCSDWFALLQLNSHNDNFYFI